MDAYAFVIERLREQDHRRLRAYELHVRCTFTTWLVVVARRLCVDWHRARFGRSRGNTGGAELDEAQFRRRLAALAYEELDPALAGAPPDTAPDQQLQAAELHERLAAAVCVLTPEDQLLLRLRFEDGLSANEIAGVLQLASPFHVYRRLTHVLAVLRRELRARGIESPVP
jgi:RNA polymerase sigma factor (sigma-70 family)